MLIDLKLASPISCINTWGSSSLSHGSEHEGELNNRDSNGVKIQEDDSRKLLTIQ